MTCAQGSSLTYSNSLSILLYLIIYYCLCYGVDAFDLSYNIYVSLSSCSAVSSQGSSLRGDVVLCFVRILHGDAWNDASTARPYS